MVNIPAPDDHGRNVRSPEQVHLPAHATTHLSLWERLVVGSTTEPAAFEALSRQSGYRIGYAVGEWGLDRARSIRENLVDYWKDLFRRERSQLPVAYRRSYLSVTFDPQSRDIAMFAPTVNTYEHPTFGFALNIRTRGREDGADLSTLPENHCRNLLPTTFSACTLVRCDTTADEWFDVYPVIDAPSLQKESARHFLVDVANEDPRYFIESALGRLLEEALGMASPRCGLALSVAPSSSRLALMMDAEGLFVASGGRRFDLQIVPRHPSTAGTLQYAAWNVSERGCVVAQSRSYRAFLLLPPVERGNAILGTLPHNPEC